MKKQLLLILLMVISPFAVFAETWTDVTHLFMQNSDFTGNKRTGWTRNISAEALNVNFECMEVFNGTFDVYQTLIGLPKGHYRLSVQAFYRAGSNDVAYWNRQDGTENLSAVIYADNKEQKVKSIYECVYSGTADDLWTPDNSSYYPNWMNSASIQFANGKYVNVVEFESDGTTRIGIRNDNHIESNWCIFDNFKLEYNGVINEADYHWTDVTGFLTNPKFDNNRKFGWTRNYSGDGVTSKVQYDCMEVWNGICDINQTLTGLPKGKYRLSAQAFFRESNSRDSYNNRQSGKDNITAVLYAGQSEQTIESVYDYSFTTNVSDTCWTPDQTVFYPNGMASTRVAFDEGAYMNMLDFEADGDIQIGIRNQNYIDNNWIIFDNFHLDYLGNITPVSDISLNISKTTLEEGESITATASVIPSNATIKNLTWFSSDPFILNVNQKGEITAFSAGTATLIVMTNDGGVRKEVSITVIKKDISDNREWTEMSYVINNGNFDINGNNEGWTIENDGNTAVRAGSLEFWNNTYFRTSQVIENLPKGHYRLSVQGYHRYGSAAADYERLIDNEQTSLAYLFVDGHRKTLVPYCSYSEQTRPSDEWISPDNGKHWMPNTMESASEAFAKDAYWNYLEFDVEKTVEDVTIGIGLDEYTKENWCIFTNFKLETNIDIDLGKTYTLSVLDESGNDLSSKVTVHWYDGQGNELGSGKSIGGIKKDTELYYSVLLDESLGKQYREVTKQKASLEEATIVCQLQRIEEVTLHGKVSAYGTPLPRAEVNLTQWLNGKYEYTVKTLTDANGEFTLNAYNDSTELIVLANGYIDNKIVRRNLNNGGELGTIEMNEVQGKVIALNLSYQEATKDGVEPIIQNWYSDTRNIGYNVQNLTKGTEITDYAIQQGNIVLPTGTDRGDRIQITVSSLNEKFTEATAEGIIADNDTANVDITLLAFGGIEAVYSQKADDNLLAMLYDSTGKLQMRTVCSSSRLTFTNLAAGTYSLVTMGYNGAIGSVADLSDLASMDLYEGTDYVKSAATVRDGFIASINVTSVPELDASKFEYTGTNTSYMPNKTQLVAGNFITLTARLDFKEQYAGKTDNAKVVVEIPEGCEFVPNSVVIGAKPIPHSLNGDKLTITVDKEDIDRRIRFCVIPTQTGTYMTSAYAEFDYKGTKTQPIGQIRFESTSGELYVPSTTRTSTITLGGIGVPKADVEVYDNDALIGTTRSLGNGKWSLSCELNNAYNLSTHSIYVKYRGEGNVVGLTEAKECFYDINAIVPKTVTMVNTAHPAGNLTPKVYETVFNYETVMAVQNYYLYWPEYPDFTFIIDLSENDTTKVSDVTLYVHTTDGDRRKLSAKYNGKLNRFVATSSFDMYSLPVNVNIDLNCPNLYISEPLYQKDAINQMFKTYDLRIISEWSNGVLYRINSHDKSLSSRCIFLRLLNIDEERLKNINNYLGIEEMNTNSYGNRYFVSDKGATHVYSYDNDSLFVFATYDDADSISCTNYWNLITEKSALSKIKRSPKRAFYYDRYADRTPRSTDALNNWRDHIIRNAINAADRRLRCADESGRIAINTAIKDLRQCVGFSIGSFLSYTLNLGMSASGRPGNVIEGAHQAWETADAARGFGEGIDGLSARARDCLNTIYSYPVCNDDDNDDDPETEDENPKHDPSGYVYEAVPTNRLEGVKATVYYNDDDMPVQWNGEEYGETNPQVTKDDGLYAWDVPQGFWKVIFEKAGYETTQTDWLPVPPPQLEINIPMSQAVAPYVENALGVESGITLDFSKYMKPNTLTKGSRVTVTCNGEKASGDVELLNLEENPFNNEEYASKIKFVPNKSFKTTDEVIITVKKEVESYAGKQMTEDFVQRVKIESEIKEIACNSVMAVDYHGTGVLELSVLPAAAAKGRTIQVASTSSMIASTDAQSLTLNDEGKARIVVSGELPGSTSLHLSIPDAGKEKYVAVSVVTKEEQVVKTPKASKLSGSTMEDSYLLTLTCATKGATIYYTIDGSCPCDEQTRKKYTGPITLPEGQITLQAVAVREGMVDSDIAEFTYTVIKDEANGIQVIEESHDFEASYQGGSIVISGAKGASCHIYDIQGRELASRNRISNQTRIIVPKTDVYIVSVLFSDEQTVVHKIMGK